MQIEMRCKYQKSPQMSSILSTKSVVYTFDMFFMALLEILTGFYCWHEDCVGESPFQISDESIFRNLPSKKSDIIKLLLPKSYIGRSRKDLSSHLKSAHAFTLCGLCHENEPNKLGIQEKLFHQNSLVQHYKALDPLTGNKSHFLCKWCNIHLANTDSLLLHFTTKHDKCTLCSKVSIQNYYGKKGDGSDITKNEYLDNDSRMMNNKEIKNDKALFDKLINRGQGLALSVLDYENHPFYHKDYMALKKHALEQHYPCPDTEHCPLTIFDTYDELVAHYYVCHPQRHFSSDVKSYLASQGYTKGRETTLPVMKSMRTTPIGKKNLAPSKQTNDDIISAQRSSGLGLLSIETITKAIDQELSDEQYLVGGWREVEDAEFNTELTSLPADLIQEMQTADPTSLKNLQKMPTHLGRLGIPVRVLERILALVAQFNLASEHGDAIEMENFINKSRASTLRSQPLKYLELIRHYLEICHLILTLEDDSSPMRDNIQNDNQQEQSTNDDFPDFLTNTQRQQEKDTSTRYNTKSVSTTRNWRESGLQNREAYPDLGEMSNQQSVDNIDNSNSKSSWIQKTTKGGTKGGVSNQIGNISVKIVQKKKSKQPTTRNTTYPLRDDNPFELLDSSVDHNLVVDKNFAQSKWRQLVSVNPENKSFPKQTIPTKKPVPQPPKYQNKYVTPKSNKAADAFDELMVRAPGPKYCVCGIIINGTNDSSSEMCFKCSSEHIQAEGEIKEEQSWSKRVNTNKKKQEEVPFHIGMKMKYRA